MRVIIDVPAHMEHEDKRVARNRVSKAVRGFGLTKERIAVEFGKPRGDDRTLVVVTDHSFGGPGVHEAIAGVLRKHDATLHFAVAQDSGDNIVIEG